MCIRPKSFHKQNFDLTCVMLYCLFVDFKRGYSQPGFPIIDTYLILNKLLDIKPLPNNATWSHVKDMLVTTVDGPAGGATCLCISVLSVIFSLVIHFLHWFYEITMFVFVQWTLPVGLHIRRCLYLDNFMCNFCIFLLFLHWIHIIFHVAYIHVWHVHSWEYYCFFKTGWTQNTCNFHLLNIKHIFIEHRTKPITMFWS